MNIKELESKIDTLHLMIKQLYFEKYYNEFEIIDGLNQHPEGVNFEQWLEWKGFKI